jgi:Lipocalin-like domain
VVEYRLHPKENLIMADNASTELIGTWKLVSMQFVFDGNGERIDVYGAHPNGHLILTPDGRMMGIITSENGERRSNTDPATLFKNMLAYSGPYRVEGDKFITSVDVAWHPSWVGTEQTRFIRFDGDRLEITTPPLTLPLYGNRLGRGVLMWQRE